MHFNYEHGHLCHINKVCMVTVVLHIVVHVVIINVLQVWDMVFGLKLQCDRLTEYFQSMFVTMLQDRSKEVCIHNICDWFKLKNVLLYYDI